MAELKCPKCKGFVAKNGVGRDRGNPSKEGRQNYRCKDRKSCNWQGYTPIGLAASLDDGVPMDLVSKLHRRISSAKGVQRYVVTAAQNATPIHVGFWKTLLAYCEHVDAQLLVVPYRYKNPTSMWSASAENEDWWAKETEPYLYNKRVLLNNNLMLIGDVKIQPTAAHPLDGMETISAGQSCIVGHPKLELTTVATPQQRTAKIMTTTGACTVKNYIESKAGKKGEFHHTFGACVVEVDGPIFHMRQINALDDGSFCELDHEYRPDEKPRKIRANLVMGDTHHPFTDPSVIEATFGEGGIVEVVNPEWLVWHDLHDFHERNHHHKGKFFINLAKQNSGNDDVHAALRDTFEFVSRVSKGRKNLIVPSNHPEALARWVEETDPRTDPRNCLFWAETFHAMARGTTWDAKGPHTIDPFAYWGRKMLVDPGATTFLKRGESFTLLGIELGMHGDKGANGSKGSRRGYTKIGVKSVIGHGHGPGIDGGVVQVGTNSYLIMGYNVGAPSSWLHTDCLLYPNGKRGLINIVGGRWRASLGRRSASSTSSGSRSSKRKASSRSS